MKRFKREQSQTGHQCDKFYQNWIISGPQLDETSMVDVSLFQKLLEALAQHAHLVIVGDVDQLHSVGPGSALADIIRSQLVPTVRLSEIFRQAASSQIVTKAHRINTGQMPYLRQPSEHSDFFFMGFGEQRNKMRSSSFCSKSGVQ